MATHKGLALLSFANKALFESWLSDNHARDDGIWLKFAKKGTGIPCITYEEAREVAIRYGWIDGLKNALDERYYTLRFTKRRARSKWSKINRAIAESLIAAKNMHAAGQVEVDSAKADGRWEKAYDSSSTMQVPSDFESALAQNEAAKAKFATVSRANRFAILYQIHEAKKTETRAARIAKFVTMLAAGEVPHPNG
jgi:uncharacterized protein YdeI (YjbR/CyaY-like superfamily)